ncbi:cobyrinate a,c-diamide synthase [Bacteroides sp. AM10-21B]|uniref:cobyrinate a,c-diamide synthase n=1 Tax=Bacteroides sp. AM10-21B TaxID=2292001 RepID=UPI000E4B916A|nr:cobyrinate a,c-diamide synthase [Bacteroides sp. AM10-21B]RHJ50878.1 cobyrinate a,c-diamide synthase [Bacteroides sp. AM10-21B]
MCSIPQFLIAAPTSGSGKTTVSRGLMALLTQKGLAVQPFKCGPDYIDTKYHAAVCGRASINLDTFMASAEHIRGLYARHAAPADVCIVEGMMGMFDGYDRDRGSSAEIAQLLQLPVVLVADAKSAAYSMAPLLAGFIHFRPGIRIAGVIFNRVGSPRHYEMLREVCTEVGVTCLGYLPKTKALEQESRYLGLDFSQSKGTDAIGTLTELLEQYVDWKLLLEKTALPLQKVPEEGKDKAVVGTRKPGGLRILVARNEESFSFIYEEHLEILREMGYVSFFNPEENIPISQDIDLLYLPGGYPEKHSRKLAGAYKMKESVREYIESGGKTLAECGGLIYLSYAVGYDRREHGGNDSGFDRMVGVFPFYISNEDECRKLTLGYRSFDYKEQHLRGHEFHYTQFGKLGAAPDDSKKELYMPPTAIQAYNAKGQPVSTPVFRYKNTIASYTHLYWGETDIMRLFE